MTPAELDRVKKPLAAVIDGRLGRVDFHALYPARVVAQNADGTLELQPDNQNIPGCSTVPIRLGLPGCTVKVASGSSVLLGFEGGDPTRPVATLWGSSSVVELAIGQNPVKHLALAEDVTAKLDAIISAFNAHTHPIAGLTVTAGTVIVGSGAGSSSPPATSIATPTGVASATVRST